MIRGGPLKRMNPIRRGGRIKRNRKVKLPYGPQSVFREAVLKRASYRCERCGCRPGNRKMLEAHHMLPRSRGAGIAWLHDPERNGACLCRRCHNLVHDHNAEDWRTWTRKR